VTERVNQTTGNKKSAGFDAGSFRGGKKPRKRVVSLMDKNRSMLPAFLFGQSGIFKNAKNRKIFE
jgi:hypothetical protein